MSKHKRIKSAERIDKVEDNVTRESLKDCQVEGKCYEYYVIFVIIDILYVDCL